VKRLRIAVASAALAVVALGAAPVIAASGSAKATVTINVTAKDFSFKLSKASVKKGTTVIFKLTNKGAVLHDFKIVPLNKKTPYANPGKTTKVTIKFTKKGSFKYICTIPRHAQEGMEGTFKVT
jgi:nitrite reductase (NO-forming)